MKGLLLKDFRFIMQQSKMFLILVFMVAWFMIFQGADSAPFVITYTAMMGSIFVLNTISYDEFEHSTTFLMTLPIERRDYVKEKYVFGIVGILTLWGISTAVYLLIGFGMFQEILITALASLAMIVASEMVMIPVQLEYGGDKGRMVIVVLVFAVMLMFFITKSVASQLPGEGVETLILRLEAVISSVNPWGVGVLAAACLVAEFYISYRISIRMIEKKEY